MAARKLAYWVVGAAGIGVLVACVSTAQDAGSPAPGAGSMPEFTDAGDMRRPQDWDRWVMVGSSLGLSYTATTQTSAMQHFHNVYTQPWAYQHFLDHGEFKEGTVFAMSLYQASRNANPARSGFYQGDQLAVLEVHVKRAGIDSTGWGFFVFGDTATVARKLPGEASCYSCHATEAGFDHVFTQFYPPLRARLGQADTPPAVDD